MSDPTTDVNPFTDEELQQWRRSSAQHLVGGKITVRVGQMSALIARLDAAEAVCRDLDRSYAGESWDLLDAWRKARGA